MCEVDHLRLEVRRDFAGDPRLAELEKVLTAKRRLLTGDHREGTGNEADDVR